MISFVLPTRDRPRPLAATLSALGRLRLPSHPDLGPIEVIVVDNASSSAVRTTPLLENGAEARVLRRTENEGASARNVGVRAARGEWIVMLDDDSRPEDAGLVEALAEAPADVAAIGAEIVLPDGRREAGGLPEVFVGCGVAIRRSAFLEAGGYDPAFGYYVEEYDLSAKLLRAGWRIVHDRRFRVRHDKSAAGRDLDLILHRLVRNNGWVIQRYAPSIRRREQMREMLGRYARIAVKESATRGFQRGLRELRDTIGTQPRTPLDAATFDRFTGQARVERVLRGLPRRLAGHRIAVVDEGKNAWAVRRGLETHEVEVVDDEGGCDLLAIGTLSPGPMMDAWERRRRQGQPMIPPWI